MRPLRFSIDRRPLLRATERKNALNLTRPNASRFVSSSTLNATLWYLKPLELYQNVKPYHINIPASALPTGLQCNEESAPYHNVLVRNLRGHEEDFSLDNSGFQVFGHKRSSLKERQSAQEVNLALQEDEYNDSDIVRQKYYSAIEKFVKQMLGAERVVAFTHDVHDRCACPKLNG